MAQGILLALLAATVYGLLGVAYEAAGKRRYQIWDVVLYMQFTGFVIGLVISLSSRSLIFDSRLLVLGLLGAATFVGSLGSYLMACREKDIGANWTIVNLSVILPILFSILWFHDTFTVSKALAIVFTVLSIVVIGGGFQGTAAKESSFGWMKYIALAFFFNAWLPILLRFVPEGFSALFTTYLYGIGFLLVLAYRLLEGRTFNRDRGLIAISMAAAGTHWSGIMLTIAALAVIARVSSQAGIVVYPITNGLVIPVGVLLGVWILKQKIYACTIAGVGMAVIALVLLSIG
jgi:drug/metabolite transporter (DMT)-like permease